MLFVRFLVALLLAVGALRPAQCNTSQMGFENTKSIFESDLLYM